MKYLVGKLFPINQEMGTVGTYTIFTKGSFDLIVIMEEISEAAIKIFDKGKCKHSAIQISNIPFLVFKFEKTLEIGFYFNVYNAKPRNVDAWLKLNVTRKIHLCLVDQKQGMIKSARFTLFPANFLKAIKNTLAQQRQHYSSMEQVDATGAAQYFKEKSGEMVQQWKNPPAIKPVNLRSEIKDDNCSDDVI